MLLILEIAAGTVLGLFLWTLPKTYRRWKAKRIFRAFSPEDAYNAAMNSELYTKEQQTLFLNLSFCQNQTKREELISALVDRFPD
jgi:hypothetical protein